MVHDALIDVIGTVAETAMELTVDTPPKHRWRVWGWVGLFLLIAIAIGLLLFWLAP
jgi:hypothetical protein